MTCCLRVLVFSCVLFYAIPGLPEGDTSTQLKVVNVTPLGSGVSTSLGRITIEFNKPMVALGGLLQEFEEIPIEITPSVRCSWRSFDANEFTCYLDDDLEEETTYTIRVLQTAESLDGSMLGQSTEYSFKTALLSVESRWTYWRSPTRPIFRLWFSRPVALSTVLETLRVQQSEDLDQIKVRATYGPHGGPSDEFYSQDQNGQWQLVEDEDAKAWVELLIEEGIGSDSTNFSNDIAERKWYIEPIKDLQPSSTYDLILAAGAKSIFATEATDVPVKFGSFKTLGEFEIVGLECTNTKGLAEQYLTSSEGNEKDKLQDCNPGLGITLLFTSPVNLRLETNFPQITPNPVLDRAYNEENFFASSRKVPPVFFDWPDSTENADYFKVGLRRLRLNGSTEYSITNSSQPIVDIFDRALAFENPLKFRTGHIKPSLSSIGPVEIGEFGSKIEVPVEYANVERLEVKLEIHNPEDNTRTQQEKIVDFGGLVDRYGQKTLNLSDWIQGRNGEFIATIQPIAYTNIGENPPESCIYGQFTPYNVQARVGTSSSVAWVTDLETGDVVPDAKVELVQLEGGQRSSIFESITDSEGIAELPGKAQLTAFPHIDHGYSGFYLSGFLDRSYLCERTYNANYALKIAGPKGYSILPLSQAFAESDHWTALHDEPNLSVWGHTAQGIYSPGDVLQYKVYVRKQTDFGLAKVDAELEFLLVVIGTAGDLVQYTDGIELNEFGSFHGEFQLPQSSVGTLRFLVLIDQGQSVSDVKEMLPSLGRSEYGQPRGQYDSHWVAFTVDVLDFVPATVRLESRLDSDSYRNGDVVTVRGRAELLSGGSYSDAPVKIQTEFLPKRFEPQTPQTEGFEFAFSPLGSTPSFDTKSNAKGVFRKSRRIVFNEFFYGVMKVTTGVRSDRGDFVWDYQHVDFRTSDRFIGLRVDKQRSHVGIPVSADVVVTDVAGDVRNDLSITVEFARSDVRGAFRWATWTKLESCQIEPQDNPKSCVFTPNRDGYYRATASFHGDESEPSQTVERFFFVRGKGSFYPERDRSHLSIQNKVDLRDHEFEVGGVAELAIEHSIPNTNALVTVERLGVFDQWVVELTGDGQFIDVPIKKDYWPRARVSIVAMVPNAISPNYASGETTSQPATRDDNIFLKIRDPERSLDIELVTDKEVYEPGDTVSVSVNATEGDGTRLSSPLELAISVVDQGVLEVSRVGIGHFDPTEGLSTTFDFNVQGFGLLSRGYGAHYMAFSSAGPSASHRSKKEPRENNELLSQWLPMIRTSADGETSFEFEAGDRLTEWNIIVVAADSDSLFGRGQKPFKTQLDIEIHPVLPNQVTESDEYDANFFVLNRTDSEREIEVEIKASGDVETSSIKDSIVLESYERKAVVFPQSVVLDSENSSDEVGSIEFLASATSGELSDAVVSHLPVHPDKRLTTHSIYGTSVELQITEPIELPQEVEDDSGSLSVLVTPSLVQSLGGKLDQIRDYPYQSWENQISKAAIAAQHTILNKRLDTDWPEAEQYVKDVLATATNYQTRSGGFEYWIDGGGHANPCLSAHTAQVLAWLRDAGHMVPEAKTLELLEYLQSQLEIGLSSGSQVSDRAMSSLRAMIVNALVQHGRGDFELVESFLEENQNLSPFAIAQVLQAALEVETPREPLDQLATRLSNSIGVSGDKALIQHDVARNGNVLHSSKLRTTCSAITAFVKARNAGTPLISDSRLASLVRGVVFEWNKPTPRAIPHQSAYCFNAIAAYAANMEADTAESKVSVQMDLDQDEHSTSLELATLDGSKFEPPIFTIPIEPKHLGHAGKLVISQTGESRLYYKATLQYEPRNAGVERENHGIDISKSYWINREEKWHVLDGSLELSRGDTVRVNLNVEVRDPLDFVIVEDPVPGALEAMDPRLATTNLDEVLGEFVFYDFLQEVGNVPWSTIGFARNGFYKRELRHDSIRFVSDYLESGKHQMQWTGRVIATGDFLARPAHAEAMYSPEVYGNSRAQRLRVVRD